MTNSHLKWDNAVMISSTMPSAKYSCSKSPLMLVNGRTAIDGLSVIPSEWFTAGLASGDESVFSKTILYTCTDSLMFFSCCSPKSRISRSTCFLTWSKTDRESITPPGSARDSRRAAIFTPSPSKLPPATTMSPKLIPIRNCIGNWLDVSGSEPFSPCCIATAHRTASTALANSAITLSPALPKTLPWWLEIQLSMEFLQAFSAITVASSSSSMRRLYSTTSAARIVDRRRFIWASWRKADYQNTEK